MFLKNCVKSILVALLAATGATSYAQIDGPSGDAFALSDYVHIAVDFNRGREGTDNIGPGFHERDGVAFATRCGFITNPTGGDWLDDDLVDGDFFMPGTEENGFGCKYNGTTYSNNYDDYEITADPDNPITHTVEGSCITIEWQGTTADILMNVKYHLQTEEVFYTTEVTVHNTSTDTIFDYYYYRNVDPDNNQSVGGTYTTENTIVAQVDPECSKSLVSATQSGIYESYVGFGALGPKFRVSYGGFSNRDGEDIWNGTGGLTGTLGSVNTADEAISIAYKQDTLAPGDSISFVYAIVLSDEAVEDAFASLYYIDYETIGLDGGAFVNPCNPVITEIPSCQGYPVTLTADGPAADAYDWSWTSDPTDPDLGDPDSPTIVVSPTETTTYTVTGTPISDCFTADVVKSILVEFTEGPDISITDPGPQCEEFDLDDLEFEDLNDTEDPNIVFLSEMPDSANQVAPEYTGGTIGPDDDVWLLIGDPDGGCFDAIKIELDFGGIDAAGNDSTIALCGEDGVLIDLHDLIEPGANPLGSFNEITASGQFDAASGILDVGGLAGTYTFEYTVIGVVPCPDDEAIFTVEVYPQPNADLEYVVDGVSSADGLGSTCIINSIDFEDHTTIPGAGEVTSWNWDFGDGETSTSENPTHTYDAIGEYTITLTVSTDDGCTDTYTKDIIIYTEPILDVIFNDPSCFGFIDGSVTAFIAGGSGTFTITITDTDGNVLNAEGSNTANTLEAGTYNVHVEDASGCDADLTVTLTDPPQLEIDYRVVEPLCYGDSAYIVIDYVTGQEMPNEEIVYNWAPITSVANGLDADSVGVIAQTYTLTVNNVAGCSNTIDIVVDQPDELVFTELGFDPAYCRVFSYQNGNGVVFASAAGGTGAPSYTWEEVATGDTQNNTTWGGRNPGEHIITVTDDNGCILTGSVLVDSLNPIADFDVISAQLNTDLQGTAPVEVTFVNQSLYYANPNNPLADPRFHWNLAHGEVDWQITDDFFKEYDTVYLEKPINDPETYFVEVCLVAQNKNGCKDTACKIITVYPEIALVNVNIFTPNGDGINDVFTFSEYAKSISTFECTIVNRWGITVGEITDINSGWDGTDLNGDPVPDGVYFYVYRAVSDNSTVLEGQGNVTVSSSNSD